MKLSWSWFRSPRRIAFALAALAAATGASLAVAPIRASSGHFAVTSWFLHSAMQAAVFVQSRSVEVPSQPIAELRWLGAAHYHGTCRPCHGAPGDPAVGVFQHATPPPPGLEEAASVYDASELFFIVRHGVKFTGMPAWPAQQRKDEVWPVVAFLQAMPGMRAEEYRALAEGVSSREVDGVSPPSVVTEHCARCHGLSGNGRDAGEAAAWVPFLSAQKEEYLANALGAYARGERASGIMQPVVARTSPEEWAAAARWYSRQARTDPAGFVSGAAQRAGDSKSGATHSEAVDVDGVDLAQRGRLIALQGRFERRVPACSGCHGPEPEAAGLAAAHPRLEGLPAEYLARQLRLFARGVRGGSRYAQRMAHVRLHRLTERELREVSAYYARLRPE